LNQFWKNQPMEVDIMLIVSVETHDKTAAESVRPSSEKRHTAAKSGETIETAVGRECTRVLNIGVSCA
jgi:hypothetical protein